MVLFMISSCVILLRIIALIFSFYGYIRFFSRKVKLEFSIAVTFSCIGSVIFLSGILNLLPETVFVLFAIGSWQGFLSVHRREPLKDILSPGIIFFAVMCVFLGWRLYGSVFTSQDNFSHWGTALKVMIVNDRFPNFQDIVSYQSYPLGSASFIYYLVKISGIHLEWVQLFAQAILMMGMLVCLFAFAHKTMSIIFAAAASLILLGGDTPLYDLTVDTLLPLTALAGIAICIYYRESLEKQLWSILPLTTFLISIKNSAILFSIAIFCYITVYVRKAKIRTIYSICPVVFLLLWRKHVDLVYQEGLVSPHSMSLAYYEETFHHKSIDTVLEIFFNYTEKVFSWSNYVIIFLILGILLFFVYGHSGLSSPVNRSDAGRLLCFSAFVYVAYQVGLLGTFVFSMGDGRSLPSYSRYHSTVLIFVAGIFYILTVCYLEGQEGSSKRCPPAVLLISICVIAVYCLVRFAPHSRLYSLRIAIWIGFFSGAACTAGSLLLLVRKESLKASALPILLTMTCIFGIYCVIRPITYYRAQLVDERRSAYDALLREYSIPPHASYLVVCRENGEIPNADVNYVRRASQYFFLSQELDVYDCDSELDKIQEAQRSGRYEYLILYEATDEGLQWAKETFRTEDRVIYLAEHR